MESNTIKMLKDSIYKSQYALRNERQFALFSETSLKLAEHLMTHHSDDISPSTFVAWWEANYALYANRQVIISALNFNGTSPNQPASDENEYIEITNQGPAILDLAGWSIHAGREQKMTFAAGTMIKSGETIRVYTFDKGEYSFKHQHPIWNNRGDKAALYDADAMLISQWQYGRVVENSIVISDLFFDGQERFSESDEYVEVANLSDAWVDISAWTLGGGHADDFVFAEGSRIAPNSCIRVYTNKLDASTGGYSWDSKRAIWNNKGGRAYLIGLENRNVSEYYYRA